MLKYQAFVGVPKDTTPSYQEKLPFEHIRSLKSEPPRRSLPKRFLIGRSRRKVEVTEDTNLDEFPFLIQSNIPALKKQNSCVYVAKHKAYFRLKGINLDSIYSLNRHRSGNQGKMGVSNIVMNSLPPILQSSVSPREKKKVGFRGDFWHPNIAKAQGVPFFGATSVSFLRTNSEVQSLWGIPGYIPRNVMGGRKLGNIMTPDKMQELLTAEEPALPIAFYTTAKVESSE
ncbi:hypothetical protein ACJMK2_033691 [Sinanodonta woodiana]|uniref:Uncharacterized protein n=1 Tax=Sinanodonta woodiana TaxID=1069815 RepID=A0ABD3WP62_SINWO